MFDKMKDLAENLSEKAEQAKDQAADAAKETKDVAKDAGDKGAEVGGTAAKEPESQDSGPRTYTVKSGDTLSAIGAKYGVSYQAIAKASGIDNPDLIFPGQVLTIPDN